MSYPVFIVCRDRLTSLVGLLDWLESVGNADEVYLIDCASTYEPLLAFYETTRHHVIRCENRGHRVGWEAGILRQHAGGRRFIYTDPDLAPVAECPPDAIERMAAILRKDLNIVKVGFGIKIDDLPDWCRDGIQAWESTFWTRYDHRLDAYRAPIDTTFALHNPRGAMRFHYKPAFRLPEPYLVRHLPWYVDPANLDDEEAYYVNHADHAFSNYARYVHEGSG